MSKNQQPPVVSVIMGSDSDLPVMRAAAEFLESFDIPVEVTIVSAHRTPHRLMEFASSAHRRGIKIVIAGAGGAAHLPGMVAAVTPLPVIGVPVKSSNSLDGWDSLLSIVQMPSGVPVATVAVNAARNAGILAAQMLALSDARIAERVMQMKNGMRDEVKEKAKVLETDGWADYGKKKPERR